MAIQHIDRSLLAAEPKLYGSKWYDYRSMHPTQATYLFVHYFNRAYGDFMGKNFDRGLKYMAAFKGKDFMLAREKKSFWRLRQRIDELGIRYEFFMRHAMDWYSSRGWKQAPRPAHLANDAEMIVDVSNAWVNECRAKIQFSELPRYTVTEFVGASDQLAYEAYLIEQIMKRPHPKYALHSALYLYGSLRIERAMSELPGDVIADAMSLCAQ